MSVTLRLCLLTAALAATFAGCGAPATVERSQRLQLEAMTQYRDEMAAYHAKVREQLLVDKLAELDQAHAASLAQAADAEGRVPVTVAMEKCHKRAAVESAFRANLARLDGEFAQRQAAATRAIDLGRETLDLLGDYTRLGTLVRSLFVRDVEAQQMIGTYETERSLDHAGSPSEPETGSR